MPRLPGNRTDALPPLALRLLGRFHVEANGQPVDPARWRRRKARHLLAMLALAPNATLHREQVLEALWPHADPTSAANSLHQTLHLARRALDSAVPGAGGWLVLESDLISLVGTPPLWVDAVAFEQSAERARSGDRSARREALELYRGALLPEDRFEEWTLARRATLHRIWLEIALAEASDHRTEHAPDAAIAMLNQVISAEPTLEEAHQLLMHVHAEAGNRTAALKQ